MLYLSFPFFFFLLHSSAFSQVLFLAPLSSLSQKWDKSPGLSLTSFFPPTAFLKNGVYSCGFSLGSTWPQPCTFQALPASSTIPSHHKTPTSCNQISRGISLWRVTLGVHCCPRVSVPLALSVCRWLGPSPFQAHLGGRAGSFNRRP